MTAPCRCGQQDTREVLEAFWQRTADTPAPHKMASTVLAVVGEPTGHITVRVSCGHHFGYAGLRIPTVGSQHDCLSCTVAEMQRQAREQRNARRRGLRRQRKEAAA